MRNALVFVGIGAVILASGWWYLEQDKVETTNDIQQMENTNTEPVQKEEVSVIEGQGAAIGDENLATFKCDDGKTITAVFERDIVGLTLSDDRQITLRQAQSGSGIRYLSNDTKIEFRGKGNEGSLVESGVTTYSGCVASN